MARRRSRQATEESLLDATISLVADVGMNGFTLSDVAKLAGVNRALIYHYFDDREKLLDRATERVVQRSVQNRPTAGLATAEQQLRSFVLDPVACKYILRSFMEPTWRAAIRERFMFVVNEAEQRKAERRADFDAAIAVAAVALGTMIWTCARDHVARELGISLEAADRRYVATLTGDGMRQFQELASDPR
jgi:AcrR family transcriptional regulator